MGQHIFISHSSRNDDVVKRLREILELEGFLTWVDSRELSGGDILSDSLTDQIRTASSFMILLSIDTLSSAWVQAQDAYLAYRRQGGYAQKPGGRMVDPILELREQGKSGEAIQFLTQVSQAGDTENWLKVSAPKYLAILQGSRDTALGDDPALDYDDAAEVLFLIERLGR